jgi:hypothetical protein
VAICVGFRLVETLLIFASRIGTAITKPATNAYHNRHIDRTFSDSGRYQTGSKMIAPRKRKSEDEPNLSPEQLKVLAALAAGRSYVDAAKEAGISDRSVRRWRQSDPEFELALRDQIQAVRESVAIAASVATQTAVRTLAEIVANPDHPLVLRAIQMLCDLSGPLPQPKAPTSVHDIEAEQTEAMLQSFSSREY